jgi:hypothetical protein
MEVTATTLPPCPWQLAHGKHCVGGWVDSRAGVNMWRGIKLISPAGIPNDDNVSDQFDEMTKYLSYSL